MFLVGLSLKQITNGFQVILVEMCIQLYTFLYNHIVYINNIQSHIFVKNERFLEFNYNSWLIRWFLVYTMDIAYVHLCEFYRKTKQYECFLEENVGLINIIPEISGNSIDFESV